MRAFLALWPDPDTALGIDRWRSLCWRDQPGAVPIQNLHVTLAFLGDLDTDRAQRLADHLDALSVPRFDVQLDQVGYQVDQSMLWLEPAAQSTAPQGALHDWVHTLRTACARAGISVDKGRYRPHLTLARRVAAPAPAPLIDPAFTVAADSFHLVSSRLQASGPVYHTERSWRAE